MKIIYQKSGGTIAGQLKILQELEVNRINKTKSIELYHNTPFIDFHFGNSEADYTSRIIEDELGVLNVQGNDFKVKGNSVVTKGDIAVITGTLDSGQAIISNYPNGFNKDNCVILSVMFKNPNNGNEIWGTGSIFNSSSYTTGSVPFKAYLNNSGIVIQTKNIMLQNEGLPYVGDGPNFNYKIVLLKVS